MNSHTIPVYEKPPKAKRTYQIDMSDFLVGGEELENNDFEIAVYENVTTILHEQDLADITKFALLTRNNAGDLHTKTWVVMPGMTHLVLLAGRSLVSPITEMIVPGTKVYDQNSKIASVNIQGGENGKDYILEWKFVTTSRREELIYIMLKVRSEVELVTDDSD